MARWPLTGRDHEIRSLRAMLLDPACPGGALVGPPGVGKTRLAEEVAALARAAGLPTTYAAASHAAARLPFGALAALLPDDSDHVDSHDRSELIRRTVAAIVDRARGRRPVLIVDDVHLLDPASVDLLTQLVVTNAAFVLATVRGDASFLLEPGLLHEVPIDALSDDALREVATSIVGGPLDDRAASQFLTRSRGNVLFLRELVLGALADHSLVTRYGVWYLAGPLRPSDRLVELVESRVASLDAPARELLELISFGEPLGLDDCRALADPFALELLEKEDLVEVVEDGARRAVRLSHPVHGEVLRARMPAVAVARVARRLADVIEAHGARRRDDVLRIATWRLITGEHHPDTMLAAATVARWRYDFDLAEQLARAAISGGAGFEARILAARLAGLQGRVEEADQELAELAATARTDEERAATALAWIDSAAYGAARAERAIGIADDLAARIVDPVLADEVTARRTVMLLVTEGAGAAARAAAPLLTRTKGRSLVWACMAAALGCTRLGRLTEAIEATERGYEEHVSLDTPIDWLPWFHLVIRCRALAQRGRFDEAETLAREQYDEGVALGSEEQQAFFALFVAQFVGDRGNVGPAARRAREAAEQFGRLGRPTYRQDSLVRVATAEALRGDHAAASAAIDEVTAIGPTPVYISVDELQARAWTAAAANDLRHARELQLEAAEAGYACGDLVGSLTALHGVARIGWPRDVVERMAELATGIEGDLAAARLAHVQALATRDAAGLDAASRTFEWLGAWLLAAETAADAAAAHRRAGDRRAADGSERRAVSLVVWCPDAATPALATIGVRWQLSPAEHETALLAAGGRTNREIAERLGLSVRTVENRLQKIYEKLGIGSRGELAEVIGGWTGGPSAR